MNENLFTTFITPTLLGFPIAIFITMFPSLMFIKHTRLITNRIMILQQWALKNITKQMMNVHNTKGQTWTLLLISLIIFIASTNILGLLPYSFTPTTQLSMNLGMAIPLWAGAVFMGLRLKLKSSLAHLLPQGTPFPLIPMLIIIETISLLIQPMALAVRLTANITAGHLLIHLIGSATLSLATTYLPTAMITLMILLLLTILEIAVALIQAYVFTLLISLYLHDNS
nr:ATP synthase F0 subunit 6 [Paraechinus nudiventris]WIF29490.1 ATP synthase F0 subunit 6 [Paraechinus nudiventris]